MRIRALCLFSPSTTPLSLLCLLSPLVFLSLSVRQASASVTVWSQQPLATATVAANAANYTGAAAYDPTVLNAPAIPSPAPPNAFTLTLSQTNTTVSGLSMQIPSSFYGFSIEMSVVNQVLGFNSTKLSVTFLNLMANLAARSGSVHIRVGGNTQEIATISYDLPNGEILTKQKGDLADITATPALLVSPDMIYMMSNISQLVDIKWYLGIPMNETSNPRLAIAEIGEAILGDNLLGFQVGNEPDLYGAHGVGGRPKDYSASDYMTDFGTMMTAINADDAISVKSNIIGPSVTLDYWTPEEVFNLGYVADFGKNLGALSIEKYPDNNCLAVYGGNGQAKVPQEEIVKYLDHTAGQGIVAPLLNASAFAQKNGKPFLMFETNTATCGGFPGISDSYASAIWALDYGLTMAYSNFSGALLHVGGQDVYYNPFTPPPTNESSYHQWTIGPIFYATLIVAEVLGNTNTAQLIDLQANNNNIYTPAYAIYEQGALARVALFNYVTDTSGANDLTVSINTGNNGPSSVQVKYFSANSTGQKDNITWAGQGFGGVFESDGRLQGDMEVTTVPCANNICKVKVPAPSFALVFINSNAEQESSPSSVQTYSTTLTTRTRNTATINPSLLATSNGHSGADGRNILGSTSLETEHENAAGGLFAPSTLAIVTLTIGALWGGRLVMGVVH